MHLVPLSEFDYHATLARASGASLVLFGSPCCGTCRKVDVQQATALARQYKLFHLPALFLYRDGQFHAELHCEVTPAALRQAISDALANSAQEEP